MDIISNLIESLATKGEFEKEITIEGVVFLLRVLSSEEVMVAESLSPFETMKGKFEIPDSEFRTFAETVAKYRILTTLAYGIKKMNGVDTVPVNLESKEDFKQRVVFLNQLMKLPATFLDILYKEHTELTVNYRKFFEQPVENLGK